jgi:hypothetical protein
MLIAIAFSNSRPMNAALVNWLPPASALGRAHM